MSDGQKIATEQSQGKLAQALREVRTASADREDVVVELREAARMRLELLAQELEPVFADVPAEDIQFDFAISSGVQPRLWIDAVTHVALGRDRRTYRFVRDTRLGRTVLAESTEIKPVAEQVTRYIAERMIERQRWLDGAVEPLRQAADDDGTSGREARDDGDDGTGGAPPSVTAAADAGRARKAGQGLKAFLSGLVVVLAGAAVAFAVAAAIYWERLAAYFAAG
ncbi:hypothetical protein GN330_19910 [Nitratireductor sp. CAU 1489]|uniref:Uncharacterized protein n=1 Tax=Nitratireductor arenosus TaxID=2682096 RepID=A0A844QN87_9HYPH|nr:hypothetical protein [Nitratireductor arenosus]MVA99518.1 hypothetical protein [Nitratireductor arenosus]